MRSIRVLIRVLLVSVLVTAQTRPANVTPGDNLVTKGIPDVPTSIADTSLRYTEYRTAGLFDWNPSKRKILIGTRFCDTTQVHQVEFPGGARTQMTFYPDRVSSASYPPSGANYIVLSKDIGGGEWFQFYRYDLANGDVTLLTDGKSRNTNPAWSHSEDKIAYSSTRRNGKDTDIYVMDPAAVKDKLLLQVEGGGWAPSDWSHRGRNIAVLEYISANESYLWIADVATGEKRLITPKGAQKISYADAQFSKDDKGLYVATDKDSEVHRLAYIDFASGQHTFLTADKWDIGEVRLSEDGAKLAYVSNEDGIGVLHVMDTRTRRETALPKLPVGIISDVKWHKNSHEIGFSLASARSPSDVYSIDLAAGKLTRWTHSETAGLNTSLLPEPELIHWKSFDGRLVSGFLYRPPAKFTGKRPVIVNIHGGPEAQFRPGFLGRNNYYLNELGVALLFPNVRGSAGYGKTFLALDNGFRREDSYKDIGTLLDWIKAQPALDGERIMITGGSYGGHMTLAISTFYADKIRCSVDIVGMSNLVTFLEHTEAYRRDLRRVEYGDERDPQMRAFLERIAPLNNVERITKPIFIVAGKNDPRVPVTEAEQIVASLQQHKVPVWYLMAKDEGHGFAKKKNADFLFYSTVMFVKEYLLRIE